jgi:hypothetical protein
MKFEKLRKNLSPMPPPMGRKQGHRPMCEPCPDQERE